MGTRIMTPVAVEFHCMTCPPLSFHTDSLTDVMAHILIFGTHEIRIVAGVYMPRVARFSGYRYNPAYRRNHD